MKKIKWNVKARDIVRDLDVATKREIGALLLVLQRGEVLNEPLSKPMRIIHEKAYELRIKDRHGIYRIIYVYFGDKEILIPHAFMKKAQKTPKYEIELAQKRLKELLK